MKKFKTAILLFLILIVTFVAFLPCLRNGFVNWDDNGYVIENTAIRHLSWKNLRQIFSSFYIGNYQPLSILSYLLDYHFFKLNPSGYHTTNLVLHLLNCILVFWLFFLLSGRLSVAFITSLLFGIHPLHVESVAWISERKDVLYALFFLWAIICYIYYLRGNLRKKYYFFALFSFILSLLSKAMAVTLPLVLFLVDYFLYRKIDKKAFIEKIPFFVLSLVFGILAIFSQSSGGAIREKGLFNLPRAFFFAGYNIIFYLNKTFMPVRLSGLYPYPYTGNLFNLLVIPCLLIAVLLTIILRRKSSRKIIFSGAFFLITLLPVLQLIPLGSSVVYERYSYIPSIAIFYVLGEGFIRLYQAKMKHYRLVRLSLFLILITSMAVLSTLTWKRCKIWKDGISFWGDCLNKYPNIAFAYNNRGALFLERKEYVKAEADFTHAISLHSDYRNSRYGYYNLAKLYCEINKTQEAIGVLKKALEINPKDADAYFNLGNVYNNIGKKEAAIAMYKKAIEVRQGDSLSYAKLAYLYKITGKYEEMLPLFEKAIANNLHYFDAYYNVGVFYGKTGRNAEAIKLFKRALKINHNSAQLYYELGNSYGLIDKTKEATIYLKKAIELNPNLAVAHNNLALSYYCERKYDLAIKHIDIALKLGFKVSPDFLNVLEPYRTKLLMKETKTH